MTTSASGGREPGQHAAAIAETVATAWNRSNGSGRRDVPLSVVAALSLLGQRDPDGPYPAGQIRAQSPQEFVQLLRDLYTVLVNKRVDLIHVIYPLMAWLFDEPGAELQRAAHDTACAALRAGQLGVTGTRRRYSVDLLGMVLSLLKSANATSANAQISTPGPLTVALGEVLLSGTSSSGEHTTVSDPAVGTGGMFRGAAEAMRRRGADPTTVTWLGADIDELAIAACAINSVVWGLGPRVVLCVANVLTEPDWAARAQAQRAEVLDLAGAVRRGKMAVDALRTAQQLVDRLAEEDTETT